MTTACGFGRQLRVVGLLVAALLASGCHSCPQLMFSSGESLNPTDQNHDKNTVAVRVFRLRSVDNFKQLAFEKLWVMQGSSLKPEDLGEDCLDVEQFTLEPHLDPHYPKDLRMHLKGEGDWCAETNYLGIVANFTHIATNEHGRQLWKCYVATDGFKSGHSFRANGNSIDYASTSTGRKTSQTKQTREGGT